MKVSVLIPYYNGSQYIHETLDSIMAQTYPIFEVLIYDDGSDSGEKHYLNQVIKKRSPVPVVLLNEDNHGIGHARNELWKMAQGELCAFLSADDLWTPQFLETSVKVLKGDSNIDGTYTDYLYINENSELSKPYGKYFFKSPDYSKESVIEWALKKNMFVNFSGVVMRKNMARHIEFTDLRMGEDLIFLLDSVYMGYRWKRLPFFLTKYRVHSQQTPIKGEFHRALWDLLMQRLENLSVPPERIKKAYRVNKLKSDTEILRPIKNIVKKVVR
jgi:glycosyltransferase involved in cell wall biosynthesis